MSALTDLQAATAALATSVTSGTAEISALLAKISNPGTSDADVEAAVAAIQAQVTAMNAAVAAAQTASP